MTWSYNLALATDKDKVRLLVGDTDTTDQLLQNEELDYFIADSTSLKAAAARVARAIAAEFSRKSDKEIGDLSLKLSQKATAYLALAKQLEAEAGGVAATLVVPMPWAGGISVAEKEANAENTALVQPSFTREMHEIEMNDFDDDLRD